MRRYLKYIKLICAVTSCAFMLVFFIIKTIVLNSHTPPFQFNQDYVSFDVITNEYRNLIDIQAIQNKLKEKLYAEEDIVIVKISQDFSRVYLYDPSRDFLKSNFDGVYFTKEDFILWKSNSIIIDINSAFYQMIENNKLYIEGEYKDVIGTYSSNSPMKLMANGCYTIETLSSDVDIVGRYYFSNYNDQLLEETIRLFQDHGYRINILHNQEDKRINIKHLIGIEMIAMIPSLIIIMFANHVTFRLLFLRGRRTLKIHLYFGATLASLFSVLLKEILCSILSGVTVGSLLGVGILYVIYRKWSLLLLLINPLISAILMIFTIAIVYLRGRNSIIVEGW